MLHSLQHCISTLQQEFADLRNIAPEYEWLGKLEARRKLQAEYIALLQQHGEATSSAFYGGSSTTGNTPPQWQALAAESSFCPGHTGSPPSSVASAAPAPAAAAGAYTPPPESPHQQHQSPMPTDIASTFSAILGVLLASDGGGSAVAAASAVVAAVMAAGMQPYDYTPAGQDPTFSAMFNNGAGPDVGMQLLLQGSQLYGSPSAAVHVGQEAGGAGVGMDVELMGAVAAAGDTPLAAGELPGDSLNQGSAMGPAAGAGLPLAAAAKGGYEGGVDMATDMDLDLPDLDWDQLDDVDITELGPADSVELYNLDMGVAMRPPPKTEQQQRGTGDVLHPTLGGDEHLHQLDQEEDQDGFRAGLNKYLMSKQLGQQGGIGGCLFLGPDEEEEVLEALHREAKGGDLDTWMHGPTASS